MAELSFMSVDHDIDMSTVEMDIDEKVSESSSVEQNTAEDVPNFERIEKNTENFAGRIERRPGTETVEICEETVNPHGKVNAEDFNVLKVIGKGGYGTVFLVQRATESSDKGKFYAMKVLKKARLVCNEKNTAHTVSERNILEVLRHPFLVRLHYAFQNRSNLYIVLEYCPGGELFRYLEREGFLMEDAACFYISEIALAIGHLHSLGIIYRDLKPENILLDKAGHVKLTDFGLSKEGACTTNTFCGTIEYMAPEIIRCAGHGKAVDWWSLGTLLFDMLSGGPPFSQEENKKATAEKILKSQVKFPPSFSTEAMSLIRGLLKKDPKERLGAKNDVEEIKQHRFFKRYDVNWTDVYDRKMEPPFRPELLSDSDVSMFDPTFTGLQPIVSPGNADESVPGDLFQGFSFVASSIIEPPPRGIVPDINRNRAPPRGVRGANAMGRLSRMNGFTPGLMTNSTASSAQSFGLQNKNRSRPEGAPVGSAFANSAANSAALPSISNRYGGCEVDDPLPSHGCDLSDFASNPSVLVANPPATTVSQSSHLLPTDRGNPEKNQVVVATGKAAGNRLEENCTVNRIQVPPLTSRVLSTFREASDEENDEDNIPGAQRIGHQVGRRGIMVGEPSATSSKVKLSAEVPLRDQRSRAPVNGNKTLADTKPFSYPNLLVPPSGLKSQPTRASSKPIVRSVSPTESVESAAKWGSHVNTSAGQHKSAAQHHQQQLHRVGSGSTAPSNAPHAMPGGNNNAKCSVM